MTGHRDDAAVQEKKGLNFRRSNSFQSAEGRRVRGRHGMSHRLGLSILIRSFSNVFGTNNGGRVRLKMVLLKESPGGGLPTSATNPPDPSINPSLEAPQKSGSQSLR